MIAGLWSSRAFELKNWRLVERLFEMEALISRWRLESRTDAGNAAFSSIWNTRNLIRGGSLKFLSIWRPEIQKADSIWQARNLQLNSHRFECLNFRILEHNWTSPYFRFEGWFRFEGLKKFRSLRLFELSRSFRELSLSTRFQGFQLDNLSWINSIRKQPPTSWHNSNFTSVSQLDSKACISTFQPLRNRFETTTEILIKLELNFQNHFLQLYINSELHPSTMLHSIIQQSATKKFDYSKFKVPFDLIISTNSYCFCTHTDAFFINQILKISWKYHIDPVPEFENNIQKLLFIIRIRIQFSAQWSHCPEINLQLQNSYFFHSDSIRTCSFGYYCWSTGPEK